MDGKTTRSKKVMEYLKVKGKIDSYAFFDLVGQTPHSGQRSIIDAYMEKIPPSKETKDLNLDFDYRYKVLVAACGRRFGKSFIVSGLAAEEMLYPHAQVLVCSYRLENCKVIFRQVRDLIKALGIEIVADRNKELELELINGARLCVASNDNVEARLGNSVSLLIIDEAKLFQRDLYETYLQPQLLDYEPYSRTILISSPQEGWLYDYYLRGQSDAPKFREFWSLSLPTSTNPTNSAAALEKLKAVTPPDIWEQEYEGKFTSAAGKVVKEFTKERCVFDESEEHFKYFWDWVRGDYFQLFHSIDSGYSHYFAGIYFMYQDHLDTYLMFGEYQQNRKVTPVHAENIHKYEEEIGFEPGIRYADPAAQQQIADLAEYGLYYNKSDKNLRETINTLNTLFFQTSAVTGRPRLLVHKSCDEAIRQLSAVMWKKDQNDQTRELSAGSVKPFMPDSDLKTDWDLFDAIRYGIHSYDKTNNAGIAIMTLGSDSDHGDDDKYLREMAASGFIRTSQHSDDD